MCYLVMELSCPEIGKGESSTYAQPNPDGNRAVAVVISIMLRKNTFTQKKPRRND